MHHGRDGIQVIALVMLGLDGDAPETFARMLASLDETKHTFPKLPPGLYVDTTFHPRCRPPAPR